MLQTKARIYIKVLNPGSVHQNYLWRFLKGEKHNLHHRSIYSIRNCWLGAWSSVVVKGFKDRSGMQTEIRTTGLQRGGLIQEHHLI